MWYDRDSRIEACLEACGNEADGNIGKGIAIFLAGLIWELGIIAKSGSPGEDFIHELVAASVAVRAAGPFFGLDPARASDSLLNKIGSIESYYEKIAAKNVDIPREAAKEITGLMQANALYVHDPSIDKDDLYDALNDAYIAIRVLERYYGVNIDDWNYEEKFILPEEQN